MSQKTVDFNRQMDAARAAKQAKKERQPANAFTKFVRELKDPKRKRKSSRYVREARDYVYAIVLKGGAPLKVQVDVAQRLTEAKLNLCFLEPDEQRYPGVLCILVKAPEETLQHEWHRLSVEHFIRTGERVEDDDMPIDTVDAGAEIILLHRILEKVLNEYIVRGRDTSTVPGWNPVAISKRMIDGVETYFPLHDEHFCETFLAKIHKTMQLMPHLKRSLCTCFKQVADDDDSAHDDDDDDDDERGLQSSFYGEVSHHFGEEIGAYFAFMQVRYHLLTASPTAGAALG